MLTLNYTDPAEWNRCASLGSLLHHLKPRVHFLPRLYHASCDWLTRNSHSSSRDTYQAYKHPREYSPGDGLLGRMYIFFGLYQTWKPVKRSTPLWRMHVDRPLPSKMTVHARYYPLAYPKKKAITGTDTSQTSPTLVPFSPASSRSSTPSIRVRCFQWYMQIKRGCVVQHRITYNPTLIRKWKKINMQRRPFHHPRASLSLIRHPGLPLVGSESSPPITDPAVARCWRLSTPPGAFRFRLQEGRCVSLSFFFFTFFRLPAVHVTQLGMNVPIISEDIGATVS